MDISIMYDLANQNSREYRSNLGSYTKEDGFCLDPDLVDELTYDELADALMESEWTLYEEPKKKMTKEEIEKVLGYKISIIPDKSVTDRLNQHDQFLKDILKILDM